MFGGTMDNPIFLRVRLSSDGGLGAVGLAANGEVEDYLIEFSPTAVHLQSVSVNNAMPSGQTMLILALVILGLATVWTFRRRKYARV